ncbi:helix-turn-helix domain-containing protein [Streptomyces sp. S3(2020)]|uniref:helix-turn-helix domain-containing protein n=1 Tax=Streptomyces sp. S3(2020) TaxID=2732044 RepID=UPI0014881192|nr:helix-turn-helix domain-containing protein [Streptomyces sp. S3(2020)]NNN30988.1 helix-turn-helix domain-containing protein [Streptomyces sp. S3(2020)]
MNVISTSEVTPEERFGFWREVTSKLWVPYDTRCERAVEGNFRAEVTIGQFGSVQATLMTSTAHSVRRTPRLIRQADPEVFKLGCLVRGGGMITQGEQSEAFGVGDLMLFDTSRPYLSEFEPGLPGSQQLLLLRFPRSHLSLPDRELRRLSAVRIPGDRGVGALSAQFLLQLARRMDEFGPSDAARLSTLTLDVLTAALADALDARATVPAETRRRALVAQIHAFIQENLGHAHLTPTAIAAAHHISLRYLHKLFHQDGHTVGGWIRQLRLERCRADLADPLLAASPVHAIASRWGFTSAAHFSQAFRHAYGLTPRDYRRDSAYPAGPR